MMIFKSTRLHDNVDYDEAHFRNLGKELAKKSIVNLRKDLEDLSDG